jgi:hypothetical protein
VLGECADVYFGELSVVDERGVGAEFGECIPIVAVGDLIETTRRFDDVGMGGLSGGNPASGEFGEGIVDVVGIEKQPSIVRRARGLAPGMATGRPYCRTCRGPRTPSSTC